MSVNVGEAIRAVTTDMVARRRDFHAHPELAMQEYRTSQIIGDHLEALGLLVTRGVASTGVVGLLEGERPGPTLMLRADMDALPIQEVSTAEYASQNPGVTHACGHDGHMAALLAVASVLSVHRGELGGRVKFVFQPAEETAEGARQMVAEGVMNNPKVDRVMGVHLWNPFPVGQIGVKPGVLFASVDEFRLIIKGRGGHGAMPHQTIDPIAISSHVINALQNLVSRESPPMQPAVLTIGTIHGGTAFNVIPDQVEMTGTLRTLDEGLHQTLLTRIPEVAAGVCAALQGAFEFEIVHECPPLFNDPEVTEFAHSVACQLVGTSNLPSVQPTTVGEDMALFLREAPGCYLLVGSSNLEKGLDAPHHSAGFDFDEGALSVAAEVLLASALAYLGT